MSALDAATFPLMDASDENNLDFMIKSSDFKQIVNKTAFAMAQQDVRYYLNGLYLNLSNKELFFSV